MITDTLDKLNWKARNFLKGEGLFYGAIGMRNMWMPLDLKPRSNPPITAYHVLFTEPYAIRNKNDNISMPIYEQKTALLSALAWKRSNGPIHLLTDKRGSKYIRDIGLDKVYDSIQDDLWDPYALNQKKFWASGKLLAWEQLNLPCAIIDMDLIVWQPLSLMRTPLAAAHVENLNDEYYPGTDYFLMSPRYQFPNDWDYTVKPLNTSILYMEDEELKKEYLTEAFRFMRYERDTPDNGSNCMIFAEQRVLAMCAARRNIQAKKLLDFNNLMKPQDQITHIWNAKSGLLRQKEVADVFKECCEERIKFLKQSMNMEG